MLISETLNPSRTSCWRRRLVEQFGVAAAYWVAGKLALLLAIPPGYATAVWPAAGLALAGTLLLGYRVWPGVLLGSFLINFWTSFDPSSAAAIVKSVTMALSIGAGAALQAAGGAWLVRRWAGFPNELTDERAVIRFLVGCVPVSCFVSPTVGVTTLFLAGAVPTSSCLFNWWTWWVGDTIGAMIFAPLALLWAVRAHNGMRRRQLSISVPLGLMFTLVVVLFVYVSSWEHNRLREDFERRADEWTLSLRKDFDRHLEALGSLEKFYASAPQVGRREFRMLVQGLFPRYHGVQALEWVPRVPDTQRLTHEEAAVREGFGAFQITEWTERGGLVRAATRAEYFPVYYVEPAAGNERALGFDLASDPVRLEAMHRARDTGQPIATGRVRLVQETTNEFAVLVLLPIYQLGQPHATVPERRQHLQGYVCGVFRVGDVLRATLNGAERKGMEMRLYDDAAPEPERLLAGATLEAKPRSNISPLQKANRFALAGRQWAIEFSLSADYLAANRSWAAWTVLAAGLFFAGLLEAFLLVVTGRTARIEDEVEQRTIDLQKANLMLKRQRLAMDAAMDGMAVLNDAGEYLYLNRAHATLFGYDSVDDLLGKPWRLLYSTDEVGRIEREVFPKLHADGKWQGEAIARRRDGGSFHEGWSLTLVEGVGLICVCRDISKQKQVEEEVRRLNADLEQRVRERTTALEASNQEVLQSRDRYAAAVRGTNDGIWDWNISTNEDYFSDRWCELLGYPPGELPQHADTWVSRLHPDERAWVLEQARAHLEQHAPYDIEYRLRTKTDDYRWFRARGQAVWNEAGQAIRMAGSISDITERRRAEMERDRFFAQSPDLLAIAGFDGRLKRVNPMWTTLLGYPEADLLAMPYLDLVFLADRAAVEDTLRNLFHGQPVTDFEVSVRCRAGSRKWIQWNITSVVSDQLFYAVGRDITERKETEERLRAYQEQLRAVSAQLLQTEEAERRRIASDIHDQVGQTLAACRIKLGECVAAASDPALKAGTEAVRALVEQAIQETRSLTFDLSPPVLHELGLVPALEWLAEEHTRRDGVLVLCEALGPTPSPGELSVLLFRIVRELLVNVAKHAGAREARVRLRCDASAIRIEVIDDGVGFDAAEALVPQGRSDGFGLFSIRDRLRFIGGRLELDSALGRGTRVVVTAPMSAAVAANEGKLP